MPMQGYVWSVRVMQRQEPSSVKYGFVGLCSGVDLISGSLQKGSELFLY